MITKQIVRFLCVAFIAVSTIHFSNAANANETCVTPDNSLKTLAEYSGFSVSKLVSYKVAASFLKKSWVANGSYIGIVCSSPTNDELIALVDIADELKLNPLQLRLTISKLLNFSSESFLNSRNQILYGRVVDILKSFSKTGTENFSVFLNELSVFREDLLAYLKPGIVKWHVGVFPYFQSINLPDRKALDAIHEVSEMNRRLYLVLSSPGTRQFLGNKFSFISVPHKSDGVFLVNSTLDHFAAAFDLGLSPQEAGDKITQFMREDGTGNLKVAAQKIRLNSLPADLGICNDLLQF